MKKKQIDMYECEIAINKFFDIGLSLLKQIANETNKNKREKIQTREKRQGKID
jgi:hypothetical protein